MPRPLFVLGTLGLFVAAGLAQFGCSSDSASTPTASGGSGTTTGGRGGSGSGAAAGSGSGGMPGMASGGGGPSGTGGAVATGGGAGVTGGGGVTGSGGAVTGTGGGTGGGSAGATMATGGARSGGQGGVSTGGSGGGATSGTGGAAGSTFPPVALDAALLSRCTGTNPIKCTIPVPANGNYNVTVELGSATAPSTSRILAELARIVVAPVSLAAGVFSKQTFTVNVRTEVHDDYRADGMVLDIVIDGTAPALHGLGFAAAPSVPTLFVAGDSTLCDWDPVYVASLGRPLERGWAQEFSQYLKPGLAVANYADSGDTAGSLYGTKFATRGAVMKAGDYLFIEFGHNDQKVQADRDAYQANLMKYISDARAKQATPILLSPVGRKNATAAQPGFEGLDGQARQLADSSGVAFIDLTALSIAYYQPLSAAALDALFFDPSESTHFSETGATQIAGIVAKALKASTISLRDFVK